MESTAHAFKANARAAVEDPQLKRALAHIKGGFIGKRAKAVAAIVQIGVARDNAVDTIGGAFTLEIDRGAGCPMLRCPMLQCGALRPWCE